MPLEDWMRVADAARELALSETHIRELIRGGRLRAERLGPRMYLVERASVEAYKRSRRPPGRPPKPQK